MSDAVYHLPSLKGRPACGVRRGVMTLEIEGLRTVSVGGVDTVDLSRVTQPLVSCRRCLDAMLRQGSPRIRQRWEFWIAGAANGRIADAAEGCTYVARVRRDDDREVAP